MNQTIEEIKKDYFQKYGHILKLFGGFDNLCEDIWSFFESKLQQSDKGEGEWREQLLNPFHIHKPLEISISEGCDKNFAIIPWSVFETFISQIISSSVSKALEKRNKEVEEAIGEKDELPDNLTLITMPEIEVGIIHGRNQLRDELKQRLNINQGE